LCYTVTTANTFGEDIYEAMKNACRVLGLDLHGGEDE
jgi:hypothetical protein